MPRGQYNRTEKHIRQLKERMTGAKLSDETRRRISIGHKGQIPWNRGLIGWNKGHKTSEETRIKIGKANSGALIGKKASEETKEKMRKNSSRYWKNKHLSEETKRKLSRAHTGKKVSLETRKRLRAAAFDYAKNRTILAYPCIGSNEKQILDNLEKLYRYKIIRQYPVEGFFLDGYIKELNLAIEVDEPHHDRIKDRDIERQKIIGEKLGCKFLRIKDHK